MYTLALSYFAENPEQSAEAFSEYVKTIGCHVTATSYSPNRNDLGGGVQQMVSSNDLSTLIKNLEQFANSGEVVPEELQSIYFEECIYYLHAVPKDIGPEDVITFISHVMNVNCINRVQANRLRNLCMSEREVSPQERIDAISLASIREAINILSTKVLGQELLTTINKQEEVKWPVH